MCHDAFLFRVTVSCRRWASVRRIFVWCSRRPRFSRATAEPPLLKLNIADQHGGVILPVSALDLVLVGLLELEHDDLLAAPLFDDLPGHTSFGSVRAQDHFLFVG